MGNFIRRFWPFILVVFLVVAGIVLGLFYKSSTSYKSSVSANDTNNKALIEKIGALAILPSDEVPTIAVVTDVSLLKDKPFFADAKKGDEVLIYSVAKRAILYDPVQNKIVNMASLNISGLPKSNELSVPTTPAQGEF